MPSDTSHTSSQTDLANTDKTSSAQIVELPQRPINVFCLASAQSEKANIVDQLNSTHYLTSTVASIDALVAAIKADNGNVGGNPDALNGPDILLVCVDSISDAAQEKIGFLQTLLDEHCAPIILLAGQEDSSVLIDAMSAGAHDYITLPIEPSLLEAKIAAQLRISQIQQVVHEQHRQLADNHEHLMHEQQLAIEVFNKVAHDNGVQMENIRHWLSPIAVFNGDVLLAAPTPNGGLMVLLGDFTGHGLAAAIGAIPLASTFYSMVDKGFTMQDIIKELNNKLYELLPVSVFCCASMAQFNFEQGFVDIWNASLPDCYILRKGSAQVEIVSSNALALGIVGGSSFDARPTRFHINSGDRLYLLSDGVLEATDSSGEQFGDERLMAAIASQADVDADDGFAALKQQVVQFIGEHARADDISLVEISMVDAADFATMYEAAQGHTSEEPVSWRFNYEVRPASLQHQDPVPLLLHMLMEVPNMRRYSGQLFTIISELYNNALDHGLLGLSSVLKHQADGFAEYYNQRMLRLQGLSEGSVNFILDYRGDATAGVLQLEVIDSGKGFDYSTRFGQAALEGAASNVSSINASSKNAEPTNLHGRGIPLLQSICSKVEYLGCGNHVKVEFRWQS